ARVLAIKKKIRWVNGSCLLLLLRHRCFYLNLDQDVWVDEPRDLHRRVRGPCSSEVFLMRLGYLGPLCYIACEYPCPHDIIEGPSESTESSLDFLYCIDHLSVCIAFPDYLGIPIRRGCPRHRTY